MSNKNIQRDKNTEPLLHIVKRDATTEPLLHIIKRDAPSLGYSLAVRGGAIVLAILFASLVTLILLRANPITTLATMFKGVFGANTMISFRNTAVLLCIALALTPAFKMRFWNTGAEGQVLIGCLASAASMYYLKDCDTWLIILVMILASLIAGAIWGLLPAIFKANWGTNETLFTLMMNSVAMCLTLFFMKLWSKDSSSVGNKTLDPYEKIHQVFSSNYAFVIVSVLLLTVAMYVYLNYSKHGYEISVVGESENTAKYVGINVKRVIIRTMTISGLICGFAGFLIVAPSQSIADSIVQGRGFTAIMVAWLAKFNPIVMILSAFLFIFVSAGGQQISTTLGYDSAYSDIFVGILLFFIIGCEFFISYKLVPGGKFKELLDSFKTKKHAKSCKEDESK